MIDLCNKRHCLYLAIVIYSYFLHNSVYVCQSSLFCRKNYPNMIHHIILPNECHHTVITNIRWLIIRSYTLSIIVIQLVNISFFNIQDPCYIARLRPYSLNWWFPTETTTCRCTLFFAFVTTSLSCIRCMRVHRKVQNTDAAMMYKSDSFYFIRHMFNNFEIHFLRIIIIRYIPDTIS